MFELVWTAHFTRSAARFSQAHPQLRRRLAQTLRELEADPFQPHLRLHRLHGPLQGLHAVSVTHAYRITLTLKLSEHEIILLDIGSHDELYRE